MPRYATGSLEKTLYDELKRHSRRPRLAAVTKPQTADLDRARMLCTAADWYRSGWVSTETFMSLAADIFHGR